MLNGNTLTNACDDIIVPSIFKHLDCIEYKLEIIQSLVCIAHEEESLESNPRTYSLLSAILKYIDEANEMMSSTRAILDVEQHAAMG